MANFVGLLKIELPAGDVFLSDGGFITFGGDTYTETDATLGSLQSVDPMTEGTEGAIPALDLTFGVPDASALTALSNGAIQRSTVTMWLVEYNHDTNLPVGTNEPLFIGQIDQPAFRFSSREFIASLACTSKLEVMFSRDSGNRLSSTFHKSMFAGETGHDNATGLSVKVAWGVAGPPTSSGGGGGFGGVGRDGMPGFGSGLEAR